MTDIQLMFANERNERLLASLVEEQYDAILSDEVEGADLYFVDDISLQKHRDDLLDEKRRQTPVFCPVVLIRREQSPVTVNLPDPTTADEPHLVDDILRTPVSRPEVVRTLINLLSRREQTADLTSDLRERNQRLERFSRALTHELRNPLQILDGYLDLARTTGSDEHFDRCDAAVERMQTMINDTLLILREGATQIEPAPVTLSDLCEDCRDGFGTADSRIAIDTDRSIVADREQLKRLFENLFRNAVEHNSDRVTITVGDVDDGDGFFVEDDGKGIPREIRDDVFDEGFSEGGAGIGLGLGVVQSIVEAHGWEVTITEGTEGGARFEVTNVEITEHPSVRERC